MRGTIDHLAREIYAAMAAQPDLLAPPPRGRGHARVALIFAGCAAAGSLLAVAWVAARPWLHG